MKLRNAILMTLVMGISFNSFAQQGAGRRSANAAQVSTKYQSLDAPNSLITLEPVAGYLESAFTEIKTTGNPKYRPGYTVGMNLLVGRGDWQFKSGLTYAERGMLVEGLNTGYGRYNAEYEMKYLEIPVMGRYSFLNRKSWSLFAEFGLVLGMVNEATLKTKSETSALENSLDVKEFFNDLDTRYSLSVGGTWKFAKNMAAVINLNTQASISPINKGNAWNNQDAYTGGYSVTLGGSFGL